MSLRPGKLPQDLLAQLLSGVPHTDPRVVAGPGIGRDAALIDMGHGRVLVAKTDPVTFATDDIGWYAVNVNANDIACMGARPSWFLATALLPPGAPEALATTIFEQLTRACAELDIELVGGHMEVTLGLDRPIIVGAMLGEASTADVVRGEGVVAGDVVLLAKSVAIEGTALLAREAGPVLQERGVDPATIARASGMLYDPGISVVREAQALCAAAKPRLMHDATEGGLATALHEMATAANARLRIRLEEVPVLEDTRTICGALGLDPLGLLASGALLAVVARGEYERIATSATLPEGWRTIGYVEDGAPEVIMAAEDSPLPSFARDELARFFDESGERPTG